MDLLVGDIGNTVTKLSLVESKTFKIKKIFYFDSKNIAYKKDLKKKLKKIIKNKKIYKVALFSCVVPKYERTLKIYLKKNYNIHLYEIKEKIIKKIVKLNIKNKNQVGSDRIANAAGVYKIYKSNCIVLDFGTATTFDIVNKNGNYNGGVIAPGVNLSIKSLVKSADQIPSFSVSVPRKIVGKNTLEALHSGFYWGYSGLVNNIINKIEYETKKKYKIIFTGGYADLFKTSINKNFTVNKNITILGIIEIFKENIKNLN